MKKQNEAKDMIITLKKVKEILCQYWWVMFVPILVMGVFVLATGKTEVGAQTNVQSSVLIAIQAEDLVDEKYLDNFLIDGRSEYTTSQSIARDVLAIYDSEESASRIEEIMQSNGFEDASVEDAKVELLEQTRVISISVTGDDIAENVLLVNTIAEELVNITEEQLQLPGARVLHVAEKKENQQESLTTYVTKKNIALIAVGVMLGFLVIGLLIIIDNKVRSREEIDWCYEGNYIGTFLEKKPSESVKRIAKGIYGVLERHGKSSVLFVSLQNDKELENIFQNDDTEKKFSYSSDVMNSKEGIDQISKAESVVLVIGLNKVKFSVLDELVYTLNNMNILVAGYILKR